MIAEARRRSGEAERDDLHRMREENAELRMRCDVLKRSVALWGEDATGRAPWPA